MGTADSAGADSYVCMAALDHKEPELEIIIKEMKLIQLSPSLFMYLSFDTVLSPLFALFVPPHLDAGDCRVPCRDACAQPALGTRTALPPLLCAHAACQLIAVLIRGTHASARGLV